MSHDKNDGDAGALLYCAGQPGSVDESFYGWVIQGWDVAVVPLGGHRDVVRKLRELAQSPTGPVAGVVDRDAWPDETLQRQAEFVEVLPFYEVESYLLHPEVLGPVLVGRGLVTDDAQLMGVLIDAARASYMPAISAHMSNASRTKGRARLQQMAAQYAEQLRKADAIIESANPDALLRYFPGRRLAQRVARNFGFLNAQHLADIVLQEPELHLKSPPISALRTALLTRLGL